MTSIAIKTEPRDFESSHRICRFCMSEESLDDVFAEEGYLHQWILDYLSIMVSLEDHISQAICTSCRIRLTEFHQFRTRCQETQSVLQSMFQYEDIKIEQGTEIYAEGVEYEQPVAIKDTIAIEEAQFIYEESAGDEQPVAREDIMSEEESRFYYDESGEDEQSVRTEDMITIEDVKIEAHTDDEEKTSLDISNPLKDHSYASLSTLENSSAATTHQGKGDGNTDHLVQCNICAKMCKSKRKLWYHNKIVHGPKPFLCHVCDFGFSNRCHLENHFRTKSHLLQVKANDLSKNENAISKTHDQQQVDVKAAGESIVTATSDDPLEARSIYGETQCNICQKEFVEEFRLKIHKKQKHGMKKFSCSVCPKQFVMHHHLTQHLKTHDPNRDGPFMCTICHSVFKLRRTLQCHVKTLHEPKTDIVKKRVRHRKPTSKAKQRL